MLGIAIKHGGARRLAGRVVRNRWTPVAITALWAAFWSWFFIVSAISPSHEGLGVAVFLINGLAPMVVMWFAFLASIRWRRAASALLTLIGVGTLVWYPVAAHQNFEAGTIVFVMATLGLPPLVAGALLLPSWRRRTSGGGGRRVSSPGNGLPGG